MTSENLEKILEEHTRKILLKSHPIGSIEIRTDDINPGTIYGGVWEEIKGCFLFCRSDNRPVGTVGGSESVVLNVDNLPAHSHGMATSGNHNHSATTSWNGDHNHNRGNMNITGSWWGHDVQSSFGGNGCFYVSQYGNWNDSGGNYQSNYGRVMTFEAARNWSGVTNTTGGHNHTRGTTWNGNHTHDIYNTGGNIAHENMPPYLSVCCWKRVS